MSNITFSNLEKKFLLSMLLGIILPLMDSTALNTLLPVLNKVFYQFPVYWIIQSYLLSIIFAIPLSAFLGQKFGEDNIWRICLLLFGMSSFIAGLTTNFYILLFARIGQGVAAGLMMPVMQTLVVRMLSEEKVRPALTTISIPSAIAPIIAPILSVFFTTFLDYHFIFLINIPFCLISLLLSYNIKYKKLDFHQPFDTIGLILIIPSISILIYALETVKNFIEFIALITVSSALYFLYHIIKSKRNEVSIINFSLLKNKNFNYYIKILFSGSIIYYGGVLLFPLIFNDQEKIVLFIGVALSFHSLGTLCSRYLTNKFNILKERTLLIISSLSILISSFLIIILIENINYNSIIIVLMFLRGAGVGLLTIIPMSSLYKGLNKEIIAQASSFSRLTTQFSASLGTACAGIFISSPYICYILFIIMSLLSIFWTIKRD
ncbi:MFS transporter [Gallibacterium anatis]|uniref:MFS transporter n=1 Tax=Gallibacterium anatis TaxID=750 RepID=UPI00053162CA|nr:MFS transporter [Gallibacterium anatis]KGQ27138.1 hypothetical protein JP27_06295 [Gallibacterium anatis]KGQ28230.1 hypothetical protein JP31_02420 [Gallibacterium anatis]WIM82847.1 MFS transporter [Gallibacterium anatis]